MKKVVPANTVGRRLLRLFCRNHSGHGLIGEGRMDVGEACFIQSGADLFKGIDHAGGGIQHVHPEKSAVQRTGAGGIHNEIPHQSRSAGNERGKGFFEEIRRFGEARLMEGRRRKARLALVLGDVLPYTPSGTVSRASDKRLGLRRPGVSQTVPPRRTTTAIPDPATRSQCCGSSGRGASPASFRGRQGEKTMRHIGTQAFGIRLPIISPGDDLSEIVADSLAEALNKNGLTLAPTDVVGVTEALVAKVQGNFASVDDIAEDIRRKFPSGEVGVVFPILSRNRFLNILKGISRGADKVCLLLQYPCDEVGNPVMNPEDVDILFDSGRNMFSAEEFRQVIGEHCHPFTGLDYISLYREAGENIEIYLSNDPRRILDLTPHVLVGEIHTRMLTKKRLVKAGAKSVFTLSDILARSVNGSGYNPQYGILGSNLSSDDVLKLFPRNGEEFVTRVREKITARCGVAPEVLIYGDGAFKDPLAGIWELADPVVSPAFTAGLVGRPREIKIKLVADTVFKDMNGSAKTDAVRAMIREKNLDASLDCPSEGTTPRNYVDLLGSLCDLISGSGDKGTPVVLIQGYFDDYASL